MRGADEQPGSMFSYVTLEERVPPDHPLREIRRITDRALERLSPRFGTLYIKFGRPSIAPEKLLRALLLQVLYTIPQRAAADGATRLQPAVSLVRGARHG
jgi:transposase